MYGETGPGAKVLVVVPNYRFGRQAEEWGFIGTDECWIQKENLERVRGGRFESWRYLDSLDRPPPPGSSVQVIEAWLARDEQPFPQLDSATRITLDAMVMFAAP